MPKWLEEKIEREYERKGKSHKQAKVIAYKTLNKLGKLHKKRGR